MSLEDTGTGKAFTRLIHKALRAYHQDDALVRLTSLHNLYIVRSELRRHPERSKAAAIRAVLDAGIDSLSQSDAKAAAILVQRFVRCETAIAVALAHDYAERTFYDKQRLALTSLAQIIWGAEEEARHRQANCDELTTILDNLPVPTFTRLFGIDVCLVKLKTFLRDERDCWLVAIEGMGGIGKTAVARQAVEELVLERRFQWVFWITARQQFFDWGGIQHTPRPALTLAMLQDALALKLGMGMLPGSAADVTTQQIRSELQKRAALIVVDNLETAADIQALVMGLDRLARPSKILLTTRYQIGSFDQITPLTLRELPRDDALDFIRHHARKRNIVALQEATDEKLVRIATITDGNPLAIKLVLGQMHTRPIDQVLDNLARARPTNHDFYHFVFRQSWEQLSETARHLLLHMPLLDTRGCTEQELSSISGVPFNNDFGDAITELARASLLNIGYRQQTMLLSIHRLTEYFILSDLVGGGLAPTPP